jgi:hypothetical protein
LTLVADAVATAATTRMAASASAPRNFPVMVSPLLVPPGPAGARPSPSRI